MLISPRTPQLENWKSRTCADIDPLRRSTRLIPGILRKTAQLVFTGLNYSPSAPPIWMVTDGCSTGVSGLLSQGEDWKTAKIAVFYFTKLSPPQQNYPAHEIEMLAGVETMLRHTDILQGVKFKWLTDHKGLIHLLNQKNLSSCQARWLEKISSFDFTCFRGCTRMTHLEL